MNIGIIPARLGSKGLPGKNRRLLCGKPLIQWSLDACELSDEIDMIVVTTNDPEVMRIARNYETDKPKIILNRPDELCQDNSLTEDAINHVIESGEYLDDDFFVLLQPTSPVRRNGLVNRCIGAKSLYNPVFTGTPMTPYFAKKRYDFFIDTYAISANVRAEPHDEILFNPSDRKPRQEYQEQELYYHDNGNVYVFSKSFFNLNYNRMNRNARVVATDTLESMQIDSQDDFDVIEFLIRKKEIDRLVS